MKILFVSSDLKKIGGIQRYNKNFLQTLEKIGENVRLVDLRGTGLVAKALFVNRVITAALFFSPRIIICSHVNFSPICYFLKKFFGFDYIVTVYGIEVARITNCWHRKTLESAKFIIKLFDQTASDVISQIPNARHKILALPNSVDGNKFFIKEKNQSFLKKWKLENSKIVLTIVRLSRKDADGKGYEKVIRAMKFVVKSIPNTKYLLVGGGDDIDRMKNLVEDLDLGENVIFTGPAADGDIIEYFNLADVFILPSKQEGFPAIVLLEALACGVPVIGGNQSDAEGSMFDGDVGLIVNPDSVDEIAQALVKVLSGSAQKKLYDRDFLRRRVIEQYGVERYRQYVADVVGHVSNGRL